MSKKGAYKVKSFCVTCNNPIYARRKWDGEGSPPVIRTCACQQGDSKPQSTNPVGFVGPTNIDTEYFYGAWCKK